jgi:hypothetical protein
LANKQYTVSNTQFGSASKRVDGKSKYAHPQALVSIPGVSYNCIYVYGNVENILYGGPISSGEIDVIIPSFYAATMLCDYVNHIFFWINDSSGSGTYGGIRAMYMVSYNPENGSFINTPSQIRGESAAVIKAIWMDTSTKTLYFSEGNAIKRGSYEGFELLSNIERMGAPNGASSGAFWSPEDNSVLYIGNNGIGGVTTYDTTLSGTPLGYQWDDVFYVLGERYIFIFGDEANDLLMVSGVTRPEIRIMTLSAPTDMTILDTRADIVYGPFFVDDINKRLYLNRQGSQKVTSYDYTTRLLTDPIDIIDYSALAIISNMTHLVLG